VSPILFKAAAIKCQTEKTAKKYHPREMMILSLYIINLFNENRYMKNHGFRHLRKKEKNITGFLM